MNLSGRLAVAAALCTLAAGSATARPGTVPAPIVAAGTDRVDRALLPRLAGPVTLRVHALAGLVVIEAPQAAAVLARTLRMAPIALCPDIDVTSSGVVLHCRSRRIVAHLSRADGSAVLDVAETRGLPWDGEDGAPIVAFAPPDAGLGGPCPGSTVAGRAECLLARGDLALAAATLATAKGPEADELVALRRGDLAFATGDVLTAASWWSRTRGNPWERLASVRLCELSWSCLAGSRVDDVYGAGSLPRWVARDLDLRRARALAFLGRATQGVSVLLASDAGVTGCASAPGLCRDIAAAGLSDPGPGAVDSLALWVSIPETQRSAASYEAISAAAAVAEREGAPIFAANLLATAAGQIPVRLLREHLLHTAELFVAGGDLVRAGVVVDFARARDGDRALAGPRWVAVTRAIRFGGTLRTQGSAP